jgi:hypothetical protein
MTAIYIDISGSVGSSDIYWEKVDKIVSQNKKALFCASNEIKSDRELALKLVEIDGNTLYDLDIAFRNDKEIVMKAISNSMRVLELASEKIKNDYEILQMYFSHYEKDPGIVFEMNEYFHSTAEKVFEKYQERNVIKELIDVNVKKKNIKF